jgi:hypothetical protein
MGDNRGIREGMQGEREGGKKGEKREGERFRF